MAQWMKRTGMALLLVAFSATVACGDDDDDGGTEADRIGIGAACGVNEDCLDGQTCLLNFKGGYCGLKDCVGHTASCPEGSICCPEGSVCVKHTDGVNYCFRVCQDKALDCNRNRPVDIESNCNGSGTFEAVEPYNGKACIPPSG